MSEDNKNSDPFDFDFDALSEENPQKNSENSAFDLDVPFGDDFADSGGEAKVSADNPFLNHTLEDSDSETGSLAEESGQTGGDDDSAEENKTDKKKKGFFGRSTKSQAKPKKEKAVKPKKEKIAKTKEEKDTSAKESFPRDWGTILCIAFSVFLLVSLLVFNIAAFLTRESGSSIMQTLCFLGAFNLVALAAAAVPILFYKFPRERTLPNVMLGIAVVALFTGVLILVTEFYQYSFTLKP